jgi:mannose-1-phosphate guanylyltransferase
VASSSKVHEDALIGPNVAIGENCTIEAGVRIKNTCILSNTTVKAHSWIDGSIIGWNSTIGKWVRIEKLTVVAEDVQIKDELYINGSFILPHKAITSNLPNSGTIVM